MIKSSHSDEPPTALAAFMTELKASKPVVGLVNDNPRTNSSPSSFVIMKADTSNNEKATKRWIPMEQQSQRGIDKILRVNPNTAASSSTMPSLEESIRLASATDPQFESSTSGAPFKPQRRNSPIPIKALLEEAEEVSSATIIVEEEPAGTTYLAPLLGENNHTTSTNSEAAPTRPRRKQSFDSSGDESMSS